jgi:hypothetical protein
MKKFRELKEEVSTPPIGVRSLYTKMYAKHGGTASKAKDAQSKAYSEVEKKHGKEMRNSLEAFHKKNMNEAVKDKFDIGEYDQEGDMAKSDLRSILANAKRVHDMLEDDDNLPEWVQSKITKAEDYMSTVANYMEAEMTEEVELSEMDKSQPSSSRGAEGLPLGKKAYPVKTDKVKSDALKILQKQYKKVKEEVELDEGRPSQRHPLEGHEYHRKSDAELVGIAKDAHKAAEAMKSHNTTAENKYRDQANDSATVRYFRKKSGMPDWYKKKYGHMKEEVEQLDEKNKPTNPELWSRAVSLAKSKFDVYPSAYANGWAAKWYKSKGGGWRSVSEEVVEEGSAYDRINARFKKLSGKSLEDTAKYHKAESEKLAKQIKDQEEKNRKMKTEAVKNDDLPFTPDKPQKKSVVVGKKPEGYSIARQLARQAMQKQMQKMKKPVKEETNKAKIVKDMLKKKNSSEDAFQKEPELSSTLTKGF